MPMLSACGRLSFCAPLLFAGLSFSLHKDLLAESAKSCGPTPDTAPSLWTFPSESPWKNSKDEEVKFKNFLGKNHIVSFFYGNCKGSCPVIFGRLKSLGAALRAQKITPPHVVLFSLDPEHDTPDTLRQLSEHLGPDSMSWDFVMGDPSDTKALAGVLGVRYKRLASGEISHTNLLAFVNEKGKICSISENLSDPMESLVRQVLQL